MNVLIHIYLDNNIGDDIMGDLIINKLQSKKCKCYLYSENKFTSINFINRSQNIEVIDSISAHVLKSRNIEYYIRIGGSMFPHNNYIEGVFRYFELLNYIGLKSAGIKLIFMGLNLGPFKSKFGVLATKTILKIADMVTVRDNESKNYIRKFKKENIYEFPDIVYSTEINFSEKGDVDILGVSAYTAYTKNLIGKNDDYCVLLSNIINKYLELNPLSRVKIFVFDAGFNSDFPSAYRIYERIDNNVNVDIIYYDGKIESFLTEISSCTKMIGTRFHSIILASLFKIPILPVIYANKTKNLLDDNNYSGPYVDIRSNDSYDINYLADMLNKPNSLFKLDDLSMAEESKGHFNVIQEYMSYKGNSNDL